MTILNQTYNPRVYNALGDVKVVDKLVTDEQLNGLGQIIVRFGHEKEVAVSKAHRHFDLDPSEVMVELDENSTDGQITRPMVLDKVQGKVQPNVLAFDMQTGKFYPVNFAITDTKVAAWNDQAFLQECAEYLKKNELADKLMLCTHRREKDEKDNDENNKPRFLETNDNVTRTSLVRFVEEMPANAVKTIFSFKLKFGEDGVTSWVQQECDDCCGCAHTV